MSGGVWLYSQNGGHYYPEGSDVSACGRYRHRGARVTEPLSVDAEHCQACTVLAERGA